jgi:gamma-glutamyltranspeptidase/glutathione hydrolase
LRQDSRASAIHGLIEEAIDMTPTDPHRLDPARPRATHRPEFRAGRHAVAAGHYLAAMAGLRQLEVGGNAIDAGVAAGLCIGVLQSDFVSVAGVAPIICYLADRDLVTTFAGVGAWPAAATRDEVLRRGGGTLPEGALRTVVPAAPDAWLSALRRYGTRRFAEVAADAIELAADGFPMYEVMASRIAANERTLRRWPSTLAVFLPNERPPRPGERFRQPALARTLERMVAAETRASPGGRDAGLLAARDEFYRGTIADEIAAFMADEGGLLTRGDLAGFAVEEAPPVSVDYRGIRVYACGAWSQGPALPETLQILSGFDLRGMGHNSAAYLHAVIEALKLAFADREAYVGDPALVDVPLDTLLSEAYAAAQRRRIDPRHAAPGLPEPGDTGRPAHRSLVTTGAAGGATDTSYLCVIDQWGNVFSATPSDGFNGPIPPSIGCVISPRGSQSWLEADHPSVIAPGKRPRLTPNPAIARRADGWIMPFGTPGGDVQVQAMLQVLLNVIEFGMTPQAAVESPRVATYSQPNSFFPHEAQPGVVKAEGRLGARTLGAIASRGHTVQRWTDWTWAAGAVCAIVREADGTLLTAGADPRRESYGAGW